QIVVRNRGALEIGSSITPHVYASSVTIDGNGSRLSALPRDLGGLRLSISGTLSLQGNGSIDATGDGLARGGEPRSPWLGSRETYAYYTSGSLPLRAGSGLGSGGSYGGTAGSNTNPTYGDPVNPRHLGSGGATQSSSSGGLGGRGGGRVWVDAAT